MVKKSMMIFLALCVFINIVGCNSGKNNDINDNNGNNGRNVEESLQDHNNLLPNS